MENIEFIKTVRLAESYSRYLAYEKAFHHFDYSLMEVAPRDDFSSDGAYQGYICRKASNFVTALKSFSSYDSSLVHEQVVFLWLMTKLKGEPFAIHYWSSRRGFNLKASYSLSLREWQNPELRDILGIRAAYNLQRLGKLDLASIRFTINAPYNLTISERLLSCLGIFFSGKLRLACKTICDLLPGDLDAVD